MQIPLKNKRVKPRTVLIETMLSGNYSLYLEIQLILYVGRNSITPLTLESLIKCQQKLSAHVHFYICIVNVCWDYCGSGGTILSFDHA